MDMVYYSRVYLRATSATFLSEPREGLGILEQLIKSTVSRELSYFSHEFLVKYVVAEIRFKW